MTEQNGENSQIKVIRTIALIIGMAVIMVSWGFTLATVWTKAQSGEVAKLKADKNELIIVGMAKDIEYIAMAQREMKISQEAIRVGIDEIKRDIKK